MRSTLLIALAALVWQGTAAWAQQPMWTAPVPPPLEGGTGTEPSLLGGWLRNPSSGATPFWAGGELLMWWTKNAPVNTPLLTGAPSLAAPGAGQIGAPGTTVLLGNQSYDVGEPRFGGRFTVGRWFDSDGTVGMEANYFFIGANSGTTSFVSSGAPGSPVLAVPYFNTATGKQDAFVYTGNTPGFVGRGGAALTVGNQLQGGEINFLGRIARNQSFSLDGLVGFRYINFTEDLDFASNNVTPLNAGSYSSLDTFHANNNYYGGQIGLRGEYRYGNFFVDFTGKTALGCMNEVVNVGGSSNSVIPGGGPAFNYTNAPGGFFAQPTNIGQHARDAFCVVPEAELKFGYNITRNLQAFVAYDFLYLSDVARPGATLDHNANPSQNATISGFPNTLTGPAAPNFSFGRSDFWAQGITFGFMFRF